MKYLNFNYNYSPSRIPLLLLYLFVNPRRLLSTWSSSGCGKQGRRRRPGDEGDKVVRWNCHEFPMGLMRRLDALALRSKSDASRHRRLSTMGTMGDSSPIPVTVPIRSVPFPGEVHRVVVKRSGRRSIDHHFSSDVTRRFVAIYSFIYLYIHRRSRSIII